MAVPLGSSAPLILQASFCHRLRYRLKSAHVRLTLAFHVYRVYRTKIAHQICECSLVSLAANYLQSLNSAVKILSLATAAANSVGALPYSKVTL